MPLFAGIISDLFPGKKKPVLDYGDLFVIMKVVIERHGLQPHPWFIEKVIQLCVEGTNTTPTPQYPNTTTATTPPHTHLTPNTHPIGTR